MAAVSLLNLIQATLRKNCNFSRRTQEKKTTPFLEWVAHGNPVKSQMQTDEELVVEFLELSLATVILMHNDHVLKVPMHCHRG